MIRILTLTISLLMFSVFAHGQLAGGAEIEFTNELHDFGEVAQNGLTTFSFEFSNTGTEPLILTSVKPSCSCTATAWPREPIMPGQKGEITVKYDSQRIGPFNKSVTIVSNAAGAPTAVVRIKGNVIAHGSR